MAKNTPKIDFAVGGQAVIEGVMMRSPHFYNVSVRDPEGKIQSTHAPFESLTTRVKWLNLPMIRGVVHFVENMRLSFTALDYSTQVSMGESPDAKTPWWQALLSVVTIIVSLLFTLAIMKALPLWVATKASALWPFIEDNYLLFNLVDGLTKLVIFFGYVMLIGLMKDIRRTFQFHGAEHKSIWAYEKNLPLTVENARKQTRFHPRCGTSFMFIVILMSVFIYTLVPPMDSFVHMLLSRIAVIPVIAGTGYELLKGSAKCPKNPFLKVLTYPGLLFQRLTTLEPEDDQLEVALHSLKAALAHENS